jgi:hypothetical protein
MKHLQGAASHLSPHGGLWLCLLAVCFMNCVWIGFSQQFSFHPRWIRLVTGIATVGLLMLALRHIRSATFDRPLDAMFRFMIFALFCVFMRLNLSVFNHLMMSFPQPLMDDVLQSWDVALGFDWNAYAQWVASDARARAFLTEAYIDGGTKAMIVILIGAIVLRRHDRVNEMAFLLMASALACMLVAPFFPAEAPWKTVASAEVKAMLGEEVWSEWRGQFHAVRSGEAVSFGSSGIMGLVTFPSYHTCMGLIVMWCSRGHFLSLAAGSAAGLIVIAATPVIGGHYFVDLLGGAAIVVLLAAAWHVPWRPVSVPRWAMWRPGER